MIRKCRLGVMLFFVMVTTLEHSVLAHRRTASAWGGTCMGIVTSSFLISVMSTESMSSYSLASKVMTSFTGGVLLGSWVYFLVDSFSSDTHLEMASAIIDRMTKRSPLFSRSWSNADREYLRHTLRTMFYAYGSDWFVNARQSLASMIEDIDKAALLVKSAMDDLKHNESDLQFSYSCYRLQSRIQQMYSTISFALQIINDEHLYVFSGAGANSCSGDLCFTR